MPEPVRHGYDNGAIAKRLHRIEGQVRGIEDLLAAVHRFAKAR